MRRFLATLAALGVVAAVPAAATAAPGGSPASDQGAAFAVSTPAEPVRPDSHGVVHTVLTVANNGHQPIVISLRFATVRADDDGRTEFIDKPDAQWSSRTDFPPTVRLAALQYRRIPVTIRVPRGLPPDLSMLGFIAEAAPPPGAAVLVYNQIATLVTVEVPGPRKRHLQVTLTHLPFIHLGSTFSGEYRASNIGTAAAMIRGQVRLDSVLSHENIGMIRVSDSRELLPAATSRHESFRYETHDWFLLVRPSVEVSYGGAAGAANAVTAQGTVTLVLPWRTVIAVALVLCSCGGYLGLRIRRLVRRRRVAREQVAREQVAREQAARDEAAREQAARDEAAREQAAAQQAAQQEPAPQKPALKKRVQKKGGQQTRARRRAAR